MLTKSLLWMFLEGPRRGSVVYCVLTCSPSRRIMAATGHWTRSGSDITVAKRRGSMYLGGPLGQHWSCGSDAVEQRPLAGLACVGNSSGMVGRLSRALACMHMGDLQQVHLLSM